MQDFIGQHIKVENTAVYGLNESIKRSAYPLNPYIDINSEVTDKDIKRVTRLGTCKPGTGHDVSLKGIIAQFDITFTQYIWQQAKRYHWFDFVSSTSTMHCITKMDIKQHCNKFVFPSVIRELEDAVSIYNNWDERKDEIIGNKFYDEVVKDKQDMFHVIVSNIPSGFTLKAAITTNYLQLKTLVGQREHHKMYDWKEFCTFCRTLPMFNELTQKQNGTIGE